MPFINLDRVSHTSVEWLWPGRLACGYLHLFDGDPGKGKSLVLMDLAARLTMGQAWPDGAPAPAPASVVVLNAEDSVSDTVRARLAAAGADLGRVVAWERQSGEIGPLLPGRLGDLEEVMARTAPR